MFSKISIQRLIHLPFLMLSKLTIHSKGFSTFFTFVWFQTYMDSLMGFKSSATLKMFPHSLHRVPQQHRFFYAEDGLSSSWRFFHSLHSQGFIQIQILWCALKSELKLNTFSHVLHSLGFSPVWILWYTASSELLLTFHISYIRLLIKIRMSSKVWFQLQASPHS